MLIAPILYTLKADDWPPSTTLRIAWIMREIRRGRGSFGPKKTRGKPPKLTCPAWAKHY